MVKQVREIKPRHGIQWLCRGFFTEDFLLGNPILPALSARATTVQILCDICIQTVKPNIDDCVLTCPLGTSGTQASIFCDSGELYIWTMSVRALPCDPAYRPIGPCFWLISGACFVHLINSEGNAFRASKPQFDLDETGVKIFQVKLVLGKGGILLRCQSDEFG